MGLRRRGGRGWSGPWPGRGPFNYLPPWQRPGWLYGRGTCRWLFTPYHQTSILTTQKESTAPPTVPTTPFAPALTKEQETKMLEQQMNILQLQLDTIKKRLEELSK